MSLIGKVPPELKIQAVEGYLSQQEMQCHAGRDSCKATRKGKYFGTAEAANTKQSPFLN